jgi:phasin family protein
MAIRPKKSNDPKTAVSSVTAVDPGTQTPAEAPPAASPGSAVAATKASGGKASVSKPVRKTTVAKAAEVKSRMVPEVSAKPPVASAAVIEPAAVEPVAKPVSTHVTEPPAKLGPAVSTRTLTSIETSTAPLQTSPALVKAASEPASIKPVARETVSPTRPPSVPPLQQKVTIMTANAFKGYEDITSFGKDSFAAFVQANAVFTKGFEDFSKEVLSLTQASMENAVTAAKAMFAVKTLKDAIELSTTLTKTNIEKLVANSSKLAELGVKVTTEALAPINARVNVAVEKSLKPAG